MMKGDRGGRNTSNSTPTRMQRLQFLIISMTMEGENKQTLLLFFFLTELLPEGVSMRRGFITAQPLLIFVNCGLVHSNAPQRYFSSLSLCLEWHETDLQHELRDNQISKTQFCSANSTKCLIWTLLNP